MQQSNNSYKAQKNNDKKRQQEVNEKVAKSAAEGLGNVLAPGVGGHIADKALNTKLGQKYLKTAGKAFGKQNKGLSKIARGLDDNNMLDPALKALNQKAAPSAPSSQIEGANNIENGLDNNGDNPNPNNQNTSKNANDLNKNKPTSNNNQLENNTDNSNNEDNESSSFKDKVSNFFNDDNKTSSDTSQSGGLLGNLPFGGGSFFKSLKFKLIVAGIFLAFILLGGGIIAIIAAVDNSSSSASAATTSNQAARLVQIAESQLGNNEAAGTHAKYLSFLNFPPSTAWCAAFVSWCANEAGIEQEVIPHTAAVSSFLAYFQRQGTFKSISSSYTPVAGDLIIWKAMGRSHIGIVKEYKEENDQLITLEGNSSDAVRQNIYKFSTLQSQGVVGFAHPNYPADTAEDDIGNITNLNGKTINVPQNFGQSLFTVTGYDYWIGSGKVMIWSNGTTQRKVSDLWKKQGSVFKNGIASINDRYLIAVAETFGHVGDKVDVYLANGKVLPCIVADAKSTHDSNITKWGHRDSSSGVINVVEFEVQRSKYLKHGNPSNNGWNTNWHSKVTKIVNGGSIFK